MTKIPEEDRNMIPDQVKMYHAYNDLVRMGDYYRVASYSQNNEYDCYMVVSKDRSEALVTFVQVLNRVNFHSRKIRLKGLDPAKKYFVTYVDDDKETSGKKGGERVYSGEMLMKAGLLIPRPWGDFQGMLISLKAQ